MSFSFEFVAKTSEADELVEKEHAPHCVKTFISFALRGIETEEVSIKAFGHLFESNNDYRWSNCTIEIKPLHVKRLEPKNG